MTRIIDEHGFRLNVGIVLLGPQGRVFWGRRIGNRDAWQFPQGGMNHGESPLEAMYRELKEEIGLSPCHVEVTHEASQWYSYKLPPNLIRHHKQPICFGQKQKWFLLKLLDDQCINLDQEKNPEFDHWSWVQYWHPLRTVVAFKRTVYRSVLKEFLPIVWPTHNKSYFSDPL